MKPSLMILALLGIAAFACCGLGMGWLSQSAFVATLVCVGSGLLWAAPESPAPAP